MDDLGINRPIKDELEVPPFDPQGPEIDQSATTDEETELNGMRRPKRGEGWWGYGPTLLPLRKGVPKPFTDGAGLCSPGRWPVSRRKLPDNELAQKLRATVLDGLKACEKSWRSGSKPKDLKHVLTEIAVGKVTEQPFPSPS